MAPSHDVSHLFISDTNQVWLT